MAEQTQTDSAVMEQTAKNFEAVDAELMATLDTLKKKVANLAGGWVGRGHTSFQQVMEQWSKDQAEINRLLRDTAGLIRSAGVNYSASDDNTATRFSNQGGAPAQDLKL